MILGILTETHITGMPEDESEESSMESKYMAFRNEDEKWEILTGYYETQDYSYQVSYKDIAEIPDHEVPEVAILLAVYVAAMTEDKTPALYPTEKPCRCDECTRDRANCINCDDNPEPENTVNGIDADSFPELARESRGWD